MGRKDEESEVMDVEKLAVEVEGGNIEEGMFGEEDEGRGEVEGELS